MHVKFLSHDKGSGRAAIGYLMGTCDSHGELRADVQVLRGNPEQVGQLIDSLKFVNRYSSAVVAFHVDDAPTDAEIQTVLDDFERVAFAGLEKNQYTWAAVLHQESDGSRHIHIIAPRVELTTGHSMNIAPPGWQKRYDPLRDALNYEHGWARPEDPRLARLVQPGLIGSFDGWKAGTDARQQITAWLTAQVASGQVNDRQDVLEALQTLGQINRQGKDYISIRLDDGSKPIRLKGVIYDQEFSGAAIRDASTAAQRRPAGREQPDFTAAGAARARLAEVIRGRAEYNQSRYSTARPGARSGAQRDAQAAALVDVVATVGQRDLVVADASQREPVELVEAEPGGRPGDAEAAAAAPTGSDVLREPSRPARVSESEITNDGIREVAHRAIEQAQRSARAAVQAVEQCARRAVETYNSVVAACRKVDAVAPKLIANMTDELERFKSEVSLTDYAQAEFGYELIKSESSASSKVLKFGGDKIIVTRRPDGHDVYFSTGDAKDNGSIVDFLQKRKAVNLGQVRKELRQWLPGSKKPAIKRPARPPERPQAVEKDRAGVLIRWALMRPYAGRYLTEKRCIEPHIIEAFGVRQDERGNACISHSDASGVVGWESKNENFTGFAAGGTRNVSFTRIDREPLKRLVVTEAALDAMSYAQLRHEPGTGYISTGGTQLSQVQREQLVRMMTKAGVPVVLAMDRDAAGEKMAQEVAAMAPHGVQTVRDVPEVAKDWNEALQAHQAAEQTEQEAQRQHDRERGLTM